MMNDTVHIKISGMSCKHCVATVREALSAVEGVEQVVQVQLDPGSATVKGSASPEALLAAVRQAGYDASL